MTLINPSLLSGTEYRPHDPKRWKDDGIPLNVDDLGVALEAKPHGAALHFRADPERGAAAHDLADRVAERFGLATKHGKRVVELTLPGADKGGAVRAFLELPPFAGSMPVFVGDDLTDEHAFRHVNANGGVSVIVGARRPTEARCALDDPAAVRAWLHGLATAK